MKKFFILLTSALLAFSCANVTSNNLNSSETSSVSTSIPQNKNVTLTICQVYEEPYMANNWGNPRKDLTINCFYNDPIALNIIKPFCSPSYTCYGDGYYWIEAFWVSLSPLVEADRIFTITKNMTIYYGCRG